MKIMKDDHILTKKDLAHLGILERELLIGLTLREANELTTKILKIAKILERK